MPKYFIYITETKTWEEVSYKTYSEYSGKKLEG